MVAEPSVLRIEGGGDLLAVSLDEHAPTASVDDRQVVHLEGHLSEGTPSSLLPGAVRNTMNSSAST